VVFKPTHVERVAVGLFLVAVLSVYVWAARYRLDPLDEGYFIYTSSRVLAGDMPYRDFATPYTPGFFYLNALLFRLFGLDLLTLRLSLVVARVALLLVMYLLARRIMPPAFALIPLGVLMAEDQIPSVWGSHPAWWPTLTMLVAVWCVCQQAERGGVRWWLVAGLAAGLGFAVKQNLGLFTLAALVGAAVVEAPSPDGSHGWARRLARAVPSRLADWLPRLAGPAYPLALCLGIAWVTRAHLDPLLFAMFVAPFGALAFEQLRTSNRRGSRTRLASGAEQVAVISTRLGLIGVGFLAVTLPWVLALMAALGPRETPFAAFLGAIDSGGYYWGMEELRPELFQVLGLLGIAVLVAWALFRPWRWAAKLVVCLAALALATILVATFLRQAEVVHPRIERATALLSIKATTNLILYLPLVAFWSAFGLLASCRVPPSLRFYLRWYLLAGALMLLNQYPRMDEPHLLWSGPLVWILGAYCLRRAFSVATRGLAAAWAASLGRGAMYVAMLGLPLAAVWPSLELRREDLLTRQPGEPLRLTTPHYVPLDLPGVHVYETVDFAWKYQQLAAYIWRHTQPGDRVFVYPAAPLLYYLVDRPNATRFNHIFPGLLSPADERESVERLASAPAAYVIWDRFGAEYWLKPTDYPALTGYIREHYEPADSIGGFDLLRRKTTTDY